jgi:eukaryotic-like serine/threonine-protein kinase
MGFLMTRSKIQLIVTLFAFIFGSCNPLRVSQIPQITDADWPCYGGTIQRTNVARSIINPPLTKIWEYDANAGYSPYAAVAEGDFLFVGNLQGEVHIVNIRTGKKVLSHKFGSSINGSPLIDGSMLYVAVSKDENTLIAFNLSAGRTAWEIKLGSIETSPLLIGDKLYVATLAGELLCINKSFGLTVWSYKDPDETIVAQVHSSPVSDGRSVIYCRDDGAIISVDAETGSLKWRSKGRKSIFATPSIAGGILYVGGLDSVFSAFDVSTGYVRWEQTLDGRAFSSQAVGDEFVYVGTGNGTFYCMDRFSGKIAWRYSMQAGIGSAPVISGGVVFVGGLDKTLYAFDGANGKPLWNWKSEGRIKTAPLIHQGYLVLLQDDKTVTAFKEGEDQQ